MSSTRTSKSRRLVLTGSITISLCIAAVAALIIPFNLNTILFRFAPNPDVVAIYISANTDGSTTPHFQTFDTEQITECLEFFSKINISFNGFSERVSYNKRSYSISILFENRDPAHFTLADTGNIHYRHTLLRLSPKHTIESFESMIAAWNIQWGE